MSEHNLNISFEELAEVTNGSWIKTNPEKGNNTISWISTDSRNSCKGSLFLALSGEIFDGHSFIDSAVKQKASAICINKTNLNEIYLPKNTNILLVEDTYIAYQQIAKFHRLNLNNIIVIGLTGSNGKTSTKDILYNILSKELGEDKVYATKANTNNHVGVPQNLLNLNNKHKFAIIEMGSNHPGEIAVLTETAMPDIALLTSIGPSHLEYFKDLKGVAMEKRNIFSSYHRNKFNCAIIPGECSELITVKAGIPKDIPIKTFGFNGELNLKATYNSGSLKHSNFSLKWNECDNTYNVKSTLTGKHQVLNATGAAFVADIVGIKKENIIKHLSNPIITGSRMKITVADSVTWINDAYNSNPASANAGIEYLAEIMENNNKTYIFLGNMLELGDNSFSEHKKILKKACLLGNNAIICAVGNIMTKAAESIQNKKILKFKDKNNVVDFLKNSLTAGDLVYLKSSRDAGLREVETLFQRK